MKTYILPALLLLLFFNLFFFCEWKENVDGLFKFIFLFWAFMQISADLIRILIPQKSAEEASWWSLVVNILN